jgi:putative heme iron utilization protein
MVRPDAIRAGIGRRPSFYPGNGQIVARIGPNSGLPGRHGPAKVPAMTEQRTGQPDVADQARRARTLMRTCRTATLGTLQPGGAPYASLVLVAADHDGAPILLLSTLAEHTKNLLADARVSLLFDGTVGLDEPLTGARVTVQGRVARDDGPRARARFLARHPSATLYAGFGDFAFYRVAAERGHIVAGFGRINWIGRDTLLGPAGDALAEAESGIVDHMNTDHADAIQLYAAKLLGLEGGDWRMTGCDPEGCDLARGAQVARLGFDRPVADADAARAELVRLVKRARAA